MPSRAPNDSANHMIGETFDYPLYEYTYSEVSDHKIRSIFTWGHSINNFREYIDNMARVRLNEVIIWNDYVPINIDEIVEYAHSYGISVVLGYSWGWREIGNKAMEITDAEGITTKSIPRIVTITPCTKRILRCTPRLFVFWKNGGKYPARPTVKIPFEGPATHVNTPAKTPNTRAMAMIGPIHDSFTNLK